MFLLNRLPADVAHGLGRHRHRQDHPPEGGNRGDEHVDAEEEGGERVADDVEPSPPDAVHEELSDEGGGELGEADGGEVDELVAGQVLRVELPADVEKVVDAQGDGEDERHLGHPRRGEESLDPSPAVFRNLPRNFL